VVPDPRTGKPYPPTAQHALRQGKVLAENILAAVRGGRQRPFRFTTIGLLAAIGKRTGVAQIMGINFSGFVAWWLWRTIYLSKLPRFEKKVRVALDWALDLLFSKDLVQFQTLRGAAVSHAENGSGPAAVRVPEVVAR
jgi:NADH dehydrogenase